MGVVHARLLEQLAAGEDARSPASPALALPKVFTKARAPIGAREGGAQAVLKIAEIHVDRGKIEDFAHSAYSCLNLTPIETDPSRDVTASLESLGWMAGYWRREADGSRQEEVWLEPLGGCMIGLDRDVSSSGRVAFEHMRIQREDDGSIVLHVSLGFVAPR